MVSIRDVAKEAGVAISTVSKVLNNYPNVSEETKQKVNAAIAGLGFVPNTIASALSSKKTGRVALALDVNRHAQTVDEIPMQYIIGAINKAKEKGMDITTVFFTMIAEMNVEEMIRYFQSQSIEGLIICGLSKEDVVLRKLVKSSKFKVVLIDAPGVSESTSSIHIDNTKAQYEVAKKFLNENNCRKVLYISGKKNGYVSEERLTGMKQLAEELGLKVLIRTGNFSELEARKLTMQYAKSKEAIICASDLMAIGAMKALIDMDIYRPVCGFDGVSLMGYAGKQMHTVRQDFQGIAANAVEELSRLMEGGSGQDIVLPHKLIRIKYLDVIS
ncbi:MAG: LacI family DNA-binding transcriptional regulator [Lachnospiraceae bacterium]|nr:LacI family DNA-binding transcriptional regulator [Lachnospiraceae bacterium]